MIDVGAGSGELLRQITMFARRHDLSAELTGVELNPGAALAMQNETRDFPNITALEGNAMWAAFQSKQIDGMSNSPPWPLKPVVDGLSITHSVTSGAA